MALGRGVNLRVTIISIQIREHSAFPTFQVRPDAFRNPATNVVSGTIKINDGRVGGAPAPNGVAFSSSGRFANVTSSGNRSSGQNRCFVSKIDSASERQIDATGPLRNGGLGGEVNIHGHMLYIASYTDTDVVVFDTRSNRVVKSMPVGGYVESEALTPDGKYLYVTYSPTYSSDKVATFDTATNESVGSPIQVGQGASALAVAPNGLYAYVTNASDGTVSVIDISIQ
jgi:DNA-binding beta-propeller fold protein YncE